MSKLRVQSFATSLDGYGAGPDQDVRNPLGVRGPELMEWFFPTRTWRRMHGHDDGENGVDDAMAAQGFEGIGAWILGRNMFGPVRGPWPDESWKGWWGDEPPYRTPMHLAVRPVLLGAGEPLWDGMDMHALGYACARSVAGERATHVFLRKRA